MSNDKEHMDKPYVLLTRPQADCLKMIPEIEKKGYTALCAPMIDIVPLSPPLPALDDYDGLIFTSANGVRAAAALTRNRDIPAHTVGAATADSAHEVGYKSITTGPGDLDGLIKLLAKNASRKPEKKHMRMLYLSGTHISKDIICAGITIDRTPVYKAEAKTDLSQDLLTALGRTPPAYALFYSSRTARLFINALEKTEYTSRTEAIKALCIAPSVVKSLEGTDWADVQVAEKPDTPHMLALLP